MVPQNGDALQPPPTTPSTAALPIAGRNSSSPSIMPSLPHHPARATSPLFAASSTSVTSRPGSSKGNLPNGTASLGRPSVAQPSNHPSPVEHDVRTLIMRAVVPHIAIHASADTDILVKDKGFKGGLWEMLRPFGEQIHGKVTIRDSVGASRSWDDYGVRFWKLGEIMNNTYGAGRRSAERTAREVNAPSSSLQGRHSASVRRDGDGLAQIEELVDRLLSAAESSFDAQEPVPNGSDQASGPVSGSSPFYLSFLKKILTGMPLSSHETFSHPVACIIAISSRTPSPIEALRLLYNETSRGDKRPPWMNGDYLRYYLLVHDEEKDEITKSTTLFEQMKRHFGLHCHLLRIRSSQCIPTDDDSVRVPDCQWISAVEELDAMQVEDDVDGLTASSRYLYESDVTAIKIFIREMVTQSIVPFMERCVATWNDQIASRRRGLSGRFISLSKKWTGFGSSRSSSGSGFGLSGASSSNYDSLQGFYKPDSPEAMMRKLADYAFMLRDWKLAQSTYDIVRSDFSDDKAWKYAAGANEMGAISTLLLPQALTTKTRSEVVDQMLDAASYSYISRCAAPYLALRCLALGAELLKTRGGPAIDDAARWDTRLLEMKCLGPIGQALFTQQVSACYAARRGVGSKEWGARRRKAAMWNVLAASMWIELKKTGQARQCLDRAMVVYGGTPQEEPVATFERIQDFLGGLTGEADLHGATHRAVDGMLDTEQPSARLVELEQEELVDQKRHRRSLIGPGVSPFAGVDASPLSPLPSFPNESINEDDGFE
ncbi:MAG: hypothetical protein M1823_001932 [Watsoniomyces obsoletus]|nr:MAG: hypothetical protein M1823_001932 [Watsoniomyces obsoletus]